jgi:hypothetical protein
MDNRKLDIINVKDFLNSWLEIVPDSFSTRNKNVKELVKNDMQLSDDTASGNLVDTCR